MRIERDPPEMPNSVSVRGKNAKPRVIDHIAHNLAPLPAGAAETNEDDSFIQAMITFRPLVGDGHEPAALDRLSSRSRTCGPMTRSVVFTPPVWPIGC